MDNHRTLISDLSWVCPSSAQFTACAVCSGHSGPVCAVDAVSLSSSHLLVASASSDSTVKLWTCTSDTGKRSELSVH